MVTSNPAKLGIGVRIGVIDTGVNPWHSHVQGEVSGCRLFLDEHGKIHQDEDYRDVIGHGTAVAGILREQLPAAEIYAIRVFEQDLTSYPSLVARAILHAAAEECAMINLSLGVLPGPGCALINMACGEAIDAGCLIVAAGHPAHPELLPAALPGVMGVLADDQVPPGEIRHVPGRVCGYAANGSPRDLSGLPKAANLWGNSFACARVTAYFARNAGAAEINKV